FSLRFFCLGCNFFPANHSYRVEVNVSLYGSQGESVFEESSLRNFEGNVLPHLDAAYNLARWLTRNDPDAEDLVQEASLRALRFFGGFLGGNARLWCAYIVG